MKYQEYISRFKKLRRKLNLAPLPMCKKKRRKIAKELANFVTKNQESALQDYNQNTVWLRLNFALINIDNESLVHILFQNITAIKQSEEEVKKLEKTLSQPSRARSGLRRDIPRP